MAWITALFLQALLSSLVLDVSAGALTCEDTTQPTRERAYSAAFDIMFPDRFKNRQRCSWLITAYREGHRLHLRFANVIMTQATNGSCVNNIIVYDGPDDQSKVLSSFCEMDDLDLETVSKQALVVVHLDTNSPGDVQFHLKYSSLEPKHTDVAVGVVLIWVFSGIIGFLCFMGFCCGILKNKMKSPARSHVPAASGDGDGRARGRAAGQAPKNTNVAARVWNIVQIIFRLQSRHERDENTTQNGHHSQQQQQQQQQHSTNRQRRQRQHQPRHQQNVHQPRCDAVATLDFDLTESSNASQTAQDSFCFQDIPVSSFTSDPLEVKPPAYEDCLKSTNPLYLYHHHSGDSLAFYNPAFDVKESSEPTSNSNVSVLTPPPPYTEIGADTSPNSDQSATSVQPPRHHATLTQPNHDAEIPSAPPPPFSPAPPFSSDLPPDHVTCSVYSPITQNHVTSDSVITTANVTIPVNLAPNANDIFNQQHTTDTGNGDPSTANTHNSSWLIQQHQTSLQPSLYSTDLVQQRHGEHILTNPTQDDNSILHKAPTTNCQDQDESTVPNVNQSASKIISSQSLINATSRRKVEPDNTPRLHAAHVPYAMMRRSGFITSLSESPDNNEGVTPVENCFDKSDSASANSFNLIHNLDKLVAASLTNQASNDVRVTDYDDDSERNKKEMMPFSNKMIKVRSSFDEETNNCPEFDGTKSNCPQPGIDTNLDGEGQRTTTTGIVTNGTDGKSHNDTTQHGYDEKAIAECKTDKR